jgi:hypothetical protein
MVCTQFTVVTCCGSENAVSFPSQKENSRHLHKLRFTAEGTSCPGHRSLRPAYLEATKAGGNTPRASSVLSNPNRPVSNLLLGITWNTQMCRALGIRAEGLLQLSHLVL